MDPISEDADEDQPPRSCCSLLFGGSAPRTAAREAHIEPAKTTNGRAVNSPAASSRGSRPGMGARHRSVYFAARESLKQAELKALKEFEDALVASMGGDESLYFDALDATEGSQSDFAYAPATVSEPRQHRESCRMADPNTLLQVIEELKEPRVKVGLSGYPGNLTEAELAACQKFRAELEKRKKDVANDGKIYEEIVRVYKKVETEPYALCRYLRARQYNVDKVFEMLDECVEQWRKAREHHFYPGEFQILCVEDS